MFRGSEESDDMRRALGNLNNTIAHIHKELGFADKVRQIHVYLEKHRLPWTASQDSNKTEPIITSLATTCGMIPNSMGQLVAVAKLSVVAGAGWI